MKLKWQQRDFKPDIDFIYYHQQDDTPMWWKKMLFNAYPSLDFDYAQSLSQEKRFEYLEHELQKIRNDKTNQQITSANLYINLLKYFSGHIIIHAKER